MSHSLSSSLLASNMIRLVSMLQTQVRTESVQFLHWEGFPPMQARTVESAALALTTSCSCLSIWGRMGYFTVVLDRCGEIKYWVGFVGGSEFRI